MDVACKPPKLHGYFLKLPFLKILLSNILKENSQFKIKDKICFSVDFYRLAQAFWLSQSQENLPSFEDTKRNTKQIKLRDPKLKKKQDTDIIGKETITKKSLSNRQ